MKAFNYQDFEKFQLMSRDEIEAMTLGDVRIDLAYYANLSQEQKHQTKCIYAMLKARQNVLEKERQRKIQALNKEKKQLSDQNSRLKNKSTTVNGASCSKLSSLMQLLLPWKSQQQQSDSAGKYMENTSTGSALWQGQQQKVSLIQNGQTQSQFVQQTSQKKSKLYLNNSNKANKQE